MQERARMSQYCLVLQKLLQAQRMSPSHQLPLLCIRLATGSKAVESSKYSTLFTAAQPYRHQQRPLDFDAAKQRQPVSPIHSPERSGLFLVALDLCEEKLSDGPASERTGLPTAAIMSGLT